MAATQTPMPRRNHYVPGFYFDRFADHKDRLGVSDRQRRVRMTTAASAVAVERDLYRLPEGLNLPERFLEDMLSGQESKAADAIKNVVAAGRICSSFLSACCHGLHLKVHPFATIDE